jgi:hypothetical protein
MVQGAVMVQYCIARICHCIGNQRVDMALGAGDTCASIQTLIHQAWEALCPPLGGSVRPRTQGQYKNALAAAIRGLPGENATGLTALSLKYTDFAVAGNEATVVITANSTAMMGPSPSPISINFNDICDDFIEIATTNFIFHVYGLIAQPVNDERFTRCRDKVLRLIAALRQCGGTATASTLTDPASVGLPPPASGVPPPASGVRAPPQ